MGDIGIERREVEFEPLEEPARRPDREPSRPAQPTPTPPQRTPA